MPIILYKEFYKLYLCIVGWWVGFGVEYCYLLMYLVEADKNSVSWGV